MLPRKNKIPRDLFTKTFPKTKVFHTQLFTLRAASPKDLEIAQTSFAVSVKVAKNAVERNRLRRRGYSAVQELLPALKSGVYMFFYKKDAKDAKFSTIKGEIIEIFKKAGAIH